MSLVPSEYPSEAVEFTVTFLIPEGGMPGGAGLFGEVQPSSSTAQLTACACAPGARMLFVREASGHSWERCSGCTWAYDFDSGRAVYRPATGTVPAR